MIKFQFLLLLALYFISSVVQAAPIYKPPEYYKCNVKDISIEDITPELIAISEYIIEGTIISPTNLIKSKILSNNHSYVISSVVHVKNLKGDLNEKKISISHYTQEEPDDVCIKSLLELDKTKVIMFLVKPDEFKEGYFYFAGHTPSALSASNESKITHIRKIVKQQKESLRKFDIDEYIKDKHLHKKVKLLIEKSLQSDYQQSSLDNLFKLGKPAIPSIIYFMEDYRELSNHRTTFPGHMHYAPRQVVDALSTTLNFLSGKNLSSLANGGSLRERKNAIDIWRLYLTNFK